MTAPAARAHVAAGYGALAEVIGVQLLPTPRANEATGIGIHGTGGQDLRTTISLLPTPDACAGSRGGAQDPVKRRAGGHSVALHDVIEKGGLMPTPRATRGGSATETQRLLPTPNTMEHLPARTGEARERQLRRGEGPNASRRQSMGNLREDIVEVPTGGWGPYAAAISRWEQILGRPAPEPTEESPKGGKRLSAVFVEWLMGLPEGWVTGIPTQLRDEASVETLTEWKTNTLTRTQQLKMLGNGVVTQQAIRALHVMRANVRKEHE